MAAFGNDSTDTDRIAPPSKNPGKQAGNLLSPKPGQYSEAKKGTSR
jgi:hypothetical protein